MLTEQKLTRERYVELTQIAKEVCEFLESKKIEKGEGCVISHIANDMWNLPYHYGLETQVAPQGIPC